MTKSAANASMSPTRLFCGRPDCGDRPKLVSTATPQRTAATLELPPRWHETWRRSVRPRTACARSLAARWLAPWKP